MILWQPWTIYCVTWIKVWMFTWHLEMKFPKNCPALLRHCCCGPPSDSEMLSKSLDVNSGSTATAATTSAPVVRDHLNVSSGSTAINDTLDDEVVSEFASRGRRGSLHSQIIAHQK